MWFKYKFIAWQLPDSIVEYTTVIGNCNKRKIDAIESSKLKGIKRTY